MPNLEDKFLKENIPGQYSQWDKDADSDNGTEDGEIAVDTIGDAPSSAQHSTTATTSLDRQNLARTGRNTGPKGVMADYKHAKKVEEFNRQVERREREELINRSTRGVLMEPGELSVSLASMEVRKKEDISKEDEYSESDDSFDDFECDDEFLKQYRQRKLDEMQQDLASGAQPKGNICLTEIGEISQFSIEIEKADNDVFCIFHLYDEGIPSCRLLNEHLTNLAQTSMKGCRFFRMKMALVKSNFDPVGLPSVLIYRSGKEVENLTPFTQHLPTGSYSNSDGIGIRFTEEDVEYVFRSIVRN